MADDSTGNVSIEDLVSYAAGEMSAEDAASIEARIGAAPSLASKVRYIRQVLETMQADDTRAPRGAVIDRAVALFHQRQRLVPSVWLNQACRAIAELLYDSRRSAAIAGFRGGSQTRHLSYRAGTVTIDIQIAPPTGPQTPMWKVRGQIESSESIELDAAFLRHTQSDQCGAEALPDEDGCFTLWASAGEYDLIIGMGVESILVPRLELE